MSVADPPLWYFARNRQIGPVSRDDLRQMVAAGLLQPTDMVIPEGASRWQTAADVPGLFSQEPEAANGASSSMTTDDPVAMALPVNSVKAPVTPPMALSVEPPVTSDAAQVQSGMVRETTDDVSSANDPVATTDDPGLGAADDASATRSSSAGLPSTRITDAPPLTPRTPQSPDLPETIGRFQRSVPPLILLNTVGLTSRLLPLAPRLNALVQAGWVRPLREVVPAVTCTVQATLLTGQTPDRHGIVGNGWLFRDTGEVRFWQQSNRLVEAELLYQTARRHYQRLGRPFRSAKLFWWFNQGAAVDIQITPKPYYGADGNKVFGILGSPDGLTERLERTLGSFPFHTFWGPRAGLPCSAWIGRAAAEVLRTERPDLMLVYVPHLDYDLQRLGPDVAGLPRLLRELDKSCEPLLDAARKEGARVWVVNECGHVPVKRAVLPNRALRQAGLLTVRSGPFGEALDTFASRAFAVCDHQLAHVYVADPGDWPRVRDLLAALPGVDRILCGAERAAVNLTHPRAGELIALAQRDAWFAYPYWRDDAQAPDYARTVDIHRKPGYDPCELFFDPKLWWPTGRALRRLVQKKLGMRTLFDVVPLEPGLVRGSHGLPAADVADRPVLIGDGPAPTELELPQQEVASLVLRALEVPD